MNAEAQFQLEEIKAVISHPLEIYVFVNMACYCFGFGAVVI